jgi:hypothetical protein
MFAYQNNGSAMFSIRYASVKERASIRHNEINCVDFFVKENNTPVPGITLSFIANGHAKLSRSMITTDNRGMAKIFIYSDTKEDVSVKAFYVDGSRVNFQYAIVNFF